MPVTILYPTGINQNYNDWYNQSGHLYTNSNIYYKDIDEGVPGSSGDWLTSSDPYGSYSYILDTRCGPLAVDAEKVTFRGVYYYSGTAFDVAPSPNKIYHYFSLYDNSSNLLSLTLVQDSISQYNQGWKQISVSNDLVDMDFDAHDMIAQWQIYGYNSVGGFQVPTTRHMIASFEVEVSGDNIKNSGVPLSLAGYYYNNFCLKPEGLSTLSSKWHGGYNYSGNFNIGYFRIEDGSGNLVRGDNVSNISGMYFSTWIGNQSGVQWHNKRFSFNEETTYGNAIKFSSTNDSAILFNSGTLYNSDNFTIFSRYFPSGSTFETHNPGYAVLLNDSLQDGNGTYNFKVETSGYTTFNLVMYNASNTAFSKSFNIDATRGFDMVVGYSAPSGYLYIQRHTDGLIASGILAIDSLRKSHFTRLGIGGLLPSGA